MTLRDAAVGSTVVVSKITGDPAYKRRILSLIHISEPTRP